MATNTTSSLWRHAAHRALLRPIRSQWSQQVSSSVLGTALNRDSCRRHGSTLPPKSSISLIELEPSLVNVSHKVKSAIDEIRRADGGRQHPVWVSAFDSLSEIASSSARHMLGGQLVLLATADEAECPKTRDIQESFAAGVELNHLFMLVQDDVMDRSTRRRGVPALHHALHEQVHNGAQAGHLATTISHALHAKSLEMMFDATKRKTELLLKRHAREALTSPMQALDPIFSASYRAASAQFQDVLGFKAILTECVDSDKSSSKDDAQIQHLLAAKGALHRFAAPLTAGLLLSGKADLEPAAMQWGTNMGVAFQALDDISDIVSDPLVTGKDAMQDVREGRLSLILYVLKRECCWQEWQDLANVIGPAFGSRSTPLNLAERRLLYGLLEKYQVLDKALSHARERLLVASECLSEFPEDTLLRSGLGQFSDGLSRHADQLAATAGLTGAE